MLLALDQALRTTGWCVLEDGKLVAYGTFTIPAKEKTLIPRLDTFLLTLEKLCGQYPIDKIAFEDVQQQVNAQTFKTLSILYGIIQYWCEFSNYEYRTLSPSHWRKIISDTYNVSFGRKREDQKWVAMNLAKQISGEDFSTDEADAFLLGLAAHKEFNEMLSAF